MNEPIETGGFRHWLRFEGIGFDGKYQIAEPPGFDASSRNIDQGKLFARDVRHGGLDKLTFIRNIRLDNNGIEQVINPQGDVSTYLDYGLDWIFYGLKKKGFEFKAYYILEEDGVFAAEQALDFGDPDITDGSTFLTCKLIDKNDVMIIRRRMDDIYNPLSDKDYKQNTIAPAPTMKCLLKATPVLKESDWSKTLEIPNSFQITKDYFICFNRNINKFDINDTLTSINDVLFDTFGTQRSMDFIAHTSGGTSHTIPDGVSMKLLHAKRLIININTIIKLKCTLQAPFMSMGASTHFFYFVMVADEGSFHTNFYTNVSYVKLLDVHITDNNPVNVDLDLSALLDISIPAGKTLYGAYTVSSNVRVDVSNVEVASLDITGYENSIDTVIRVMRWGDLLKRGIKQYSNLPVTAPKFEAGGPFYDNGVFNRAMISQKIDTMNVTLTNTLGSVEEVNCDTEMNETQIFIDHYNEYYKNTELGSLKTVPAESGRWGYNSRYMNKLFRYAYNKYEQFRTSEGTSQSIHTESEFAIINDNADNTKEIKNKLIRDPLAIQAMVDIEITQPTTSVSEDDDLYIMELAALPVGTHGGFGNYLNMRFANGKLQILNRDSEGDSSDVIVNWTFYGLAVGSAFEIVDSSAQHPSEFPNPAVNGNVGTYTIFDISPSIITLVPLSATPDFSGDAFIKVDYVYTGVDFVSRTDEGFISNPTKFINAGRSIKRNILEWFGEMLATMSMYTDFDLTNNYFKSNGAFSSQQTTEAFPIVENATILKTDLPTPLITPVLWNIKLVCSFEQSKTIETNYQISRGYLRCVDLENEKVIKIYPQKSKSKWSNNELTIIGEEKYENPFVSITSVDGKILVDDIDHELNGVLNWFSISGVGIFRALDSKSMLICSPIEFDKVKVNGVFYSTPEDLLNALLALV